MENTLNVFLSTLFIKFFDNDSVTPKEIIISVFLPTSGIFLGEFLLLAGRVSVALWIYTFMLILCTTGPFYYREYAVNFQGFILIPVFRLVNLSMPVFAELTLYWILLVYLCITIAGSQFLWQSDVIGFKINIRDSLPWLLVAIVGGLALAEGVYRFDSVPFLIQETTTIGLQFLAGVVILAAIAEEILFRGILQSSIEHRFGSAVAVLVASIVFAATRTSLGPVTVGTSFVAGIAYGVCYDRSRSLLVPLLLHSTVNVLLFAIFPVYGSIVQTVV